LNALRRSLANLVFGAGRKREGPLRVFSFEQHDIGVFAQLTAILLVAVYCDERGYRPKFIVKNANLLGGDRSGNWLDDFFEQNKISAVDDAEILSAVRDKNYVTIKNRYDINQIARGAPEAELQNELGGIETAARLFHRYLAIKPFVRAAADRFVKDGFPKGGFISVHFRGTDKVGTEAGQVDFDHMHRAIQKYDTCPSIFVATDCIDFAESCRDRYGDRAIFYCYPKEGSHQEQQEDNYRKSLDALVDCLILAKGKVLIKTPSALSAWSKLLSPDLPLVLVGVPFEAPHNEKSLVGAGYWPESRLHDPDKSAMRKNGVLEIRL